MPIETGISFSLPFGRREDEDRFLRAAMNRCPPATSILIRRCEASAGIKTRWLPSGSVLAVKVGPPC
ncbi:MAG: hypothetical protein R3E00_04575 [Paracoccaceae bacterium]